MNPYMTPSGAIQGGAYGGIKLIDDARSIEQEVDELIKAQEIKSQGP